MNERELRKNHNNNTFFKQHKSYNTLGKNNNNFEKKRFSYTVILLKLLDSGAQPEFDTNT